MNIHDIETLLEVEKYYLFYWKFTDNSIQHHLRIAKIVYNGLKCNLLYTVDVQYVDSFNNNTWIVGISNGIGDWSLDYVYGKDLLIYELTDSEIYNNVLIYEI